MHVNDTFGTSMQKGIGAVHEKANMLAIAFRSASAAYGIQGGLSALLCVVGKRKQNDWLSIS